MVRGEIFLKMNTNNNGKFQMRLYLKVNEFYIIGTN